MKVVQGLDGRKSVNDFLKQILVDSEVLFAVCDGIFLGVFDRILLGPDPSMGGGRSRQERNDFQTEAVGLGGKIHKLAYGNRRVLRLGEVCPRNDVSEGEQNRVEPEFAQVMKVRARDIQVDGDVHELVRIAGAVPVVVGRHTIDHEEQDEHSLFCIRIVSDDSRIEAGGG